MNDVELTLNDTNEFSAPIPAELSESAPTETTELYEEQYNVYEDPLFGRKSCIPCDLLMAGCFLSYLLVTAVFGFKYGDEGAQSDWNDQDNLVLKFSIAIAFIALGFASLWSLFMILFAKVFINLSLAFLVVTQIVLAVTWTIKLKDENNDWFWWPAVVFSIGALLILILICVIQKQIAFSTALLRVAGKACVMNPMVFFFTILFAILKITFFLLAIYASLGIGEHFNLTDGQKAGVWICFSLGILWSYSVFRGLVQVFTADVVANWCRDSSISCLYSLRAFVRTVSVHLGGVAMGSIFVAILEFINMIVTQTARMFASEGNCCAACCMYCLRGLLGCIEYMLKVFTKYAYTYMGALNMSFCSAGKEVVEMLESKGMMAISSDLLIENLMWFGSLVIGGCCAAISDVFATGKSDLQDDAAALSAIGFFLGYITSMVIFDCICSAVNTIFVVYSRDFTRARMNVVRPRQFQKLDKVWTLAYPPKC